MKEIEVVDNAGDLGATLTGTGSHPLDQAPAGLVASRFDPSRETWESINQWCDDTFGPASIPQIIARAKEEWEELEAPGADHAIEAADVVICLCRIPGFADALQRKMAINRTRKWRLVGNGTGYHIPEEPVRDRDRSGEADETAQQAQPEARARAEGIAQ